MMIYRISITFIFLSIILISPQAKEPLSRADSQWGLHFDLHPNPGDPALGADLSEENIDDLLRRVKPDFVQYDCKGHAGYLGYSSDVFTSAPNIINDSLALWRKATRKHGVTLFIHFSGVWDSLAVQQHPEWARLDANGKPDGNNMSVFGPYVSQRMIPQLKEVVENYDLDGLWVDGECWSAQLDYSPWAMKAWKEKTGLDAAPKKRGDANWDQWKQFHRDQFEAYLTRWVEALHAFRPDLQITSNWMYTTFAPIPVKAPLDYISGDYTHQLSLYQVRLDARYIGQTKMPWDLMAWGFHKGPDQSWTLKPADQLKQEAAEVLMQGGGFQVYNQPTRRGYIVPAMIDCLEEVGEFVRERREATFRTESVPQAAVLLSSESMLDRSDRVFSPWGGEYNELKGALDALLDLHCSVDVVAEHQLKPYPLIVVPEARKISPSVKQKLLDLVEQGSSLLLLGLEPSRIFENELGVEINNEVHTGSVEVGSRIGTANANGDWGNVNLIDAQATAFRYPTRDMRKDPQTAATIRSLGKGKIAAIYGPVCIHYNRGHQPQLREFIGAVASQLFAPQFTVAGPQHLEFALRKHNSGMTMLNILNTANAPTSERWGFTESIPSVRDIEVTIMLDKKPRKIELLPSKAKTKWSWKKGKAIVKITEIHIHETLVIHE